VLELLVAILGILALLHYLGLVRRVQLLALETRDLTEELTDERRDCVFWMKVAEQMEKSGGTSKLLNQRREGRRIVNRAIARKS